jgi:alcohol dehydrogenase class IV
MHLTGFTIFRMPQILFGEGTLSKLPELIGIYGNRVLLVTGSRSLIYSQGWPVLQDQLHSAGIQWHHFTVDDEPSPQLVDEAVHEFNDLDLDVVVGIGGGSALDAAKAIAGMLSHGNSILDHLEGVGQELPYQGPSTPFIAVPTSAGTGSEATKNAVLSIRGRQGFKRSFRSDLLVAQYAIVDPDLLKTCPQKLIAAGGMDALTQLIESYVSLKASLFTDALAWSGLKTAAEGLVAWYDGGEQAVGARRAMSYAALMSGITLAQAGLGAVHGLASPLGAFFPMPHGVVCGTLAGAVAAMNIRAMQEREPENPALKKYAAIGVLLSGRADLNDDPEAAVEALVQTLSNWTKRFCMPRLQEFGMLDADVPLVVANSRGSSMKTNPIVLKDGEIAEILRNRL